MLIQATTGNETFSGDNPKTLVVNGLYEFPAALNIPAQAFSSACRDVRSQFARIGAPEKLPASARSAKHGTWEISRYNVPEFSLLRIELQRRSANFGYDYRKVYLRMREGAAMRQIRIPFTGHEHANMVAGYWEGRFDIVKPEWFDAMSLKVLQPQHYDQSDLDTWFTVQVMEPELAPYRPTQVTKVETVSGRTLALPKKTGMRKLTLRPR